MCICIFTYFHIIYVLFAISPFFLFNYPIICFFNICIELYSFLNNTDIINNEQYTNIRREERVTLYMHAPVYGYRCILEAFDFVLLTVLTLQYMSLHSSEDPQTNYI